MFSHCPPLLTSPVVVEKKIHDSLGEPTCHLPITIVVKQKQLQLVMWSTGCTIRDEAEFRSKSKRRIRSISGPSTKPLQQMNQRYPARAMTSSPNSGDSLTACTPRNTTQDSLDFWKIRTPRASNTAKVTATDRHLVFDLMSSPGS
ncbi:unnamed protein product [Pleuronectes platessa]|uniref:Uncharacterized protein n=1 Tax=Pleuronectes platessa TaxID=8262 RepID=A0A9N7TQU8_PLEPL|nr:unnamed protein product [Pleuronectes platessa]